MAQDMSIDHFRKYWPLEKRKWSTEDGANQRRLRRDVSEQWTEGGHPTSHIWPL